MSGNAKCSDPRRETKTCSQSFVRSQVCIFAKLWVLIFVLAVGMAGYIVIEFMEWKKRPSSAAESNMD